MLTETQQAHINTQIHVELLDLEKHVAWHDSYSLDQFVVRQTDAGWVAMVKAHRNGKPVIAYVNGGTFAACLELAGEFAQRGCLTWQLDKHPSKRMKGLLRPFYR